MGLPLTINRPGPLAVAPAVAAAAVAGIGVGLLWIRDQLVRGQLRDAIHSNDTVQDGVYRKPDYGRMPSQGLQNSLQLLNNLRTDGYMLQPGNVYLERREVQRELLRRSGGGGFMFIAPELPTADPLAEGLVLAGAASIALVGSAGKLLFSIGRQIGQWAAQLWGLLRRTSAVRDVIWDEDKLVDLRFDTAGTVVFWVGIESGIRRYSCATGAPGSFVDRTTVTGSYQASNCRGVRLSKASNTGGWDCSATGNKTTFIYSQTLGANGWSADGVAGNVSGSDPGKDYGHHWIRGWLKDVKWNGTAVKPRVTAPLPVLGMPRVAEAAQPVRVPTVAPTPAYLPKAVPGAKPVPEPEGLRSPSQPARLPASPGISTSPRRRPSTVPGRRLVGTAGVIAPPKAPPIVTPPDQIIPWPGADPIGGPAQQPRPTPEGIAAEQGKLEQKLEQMMRGKGPDRENGVLDLIDKVKMLIDLLTLANPAGEYKLYSPCHSEDEQGSSKLPLEYQWGPSVGIGGMVVKRLDAIAGMLQGEKVLRQPICRPKEEVKGELVSVNFESEEVSGQGAKRLRKLLRYRDQNYRSLESHVAHWDGFSWAAGPYVVTHKGGSWGVVQVWAASGAEGKRVIGHAAQISGVDLESEGSYWEVTATQSQRLGQPGVMRVRRLRNGAWMISKRHGSDGLPEYVTPIG